MGVLLRHKVDVTGCGRTDAGVHARYYVAHFDAEADLPPNFEYSLNILLPKDVAIFGVAPVAPDAHARCVPTQRTRLTFPSLEGRESALTLSPREALPCRR